MIFELPDIVDYTTKPFKLTKVNTNVYNEQTREEIPIVLFELSIYDYEFQDWRPKATYLNKEMLKNYHNIENPEELLDETKNDPRLYIHIKIPRQEPRFEWFHQTSLYEIQAEEAFRNSMLQRA